MQISLDTNSIADYRRFLKSKSLPSYRVQGRTVWFPDEYAGLMGGDASEVNESEYDPISGLFDYQRDIAALAIRKKKFAVFADCGLGKTLILMEFARHCAISLQPGRCVLIVSPLMVIEQTLAEVSRWYGDNLPIDVVPAKHLKEWVETGGHADIRLPNRIGITNYEAIRDELTQGYLGALVIDESSAMKSAYGKWATKLIELGKGLEYKLCATGTPAPNDRIEYANHAVFLDQFPTVNSFLARYFVNRGQTCERWELRPHALRPFYTALSHWCLFLTNPATYGWTNNCDELPPIHVHIHEVDLTSEQVDIIGKDAGTLFACDFGGITNRGKMGQLAKGRYKGREVATHKPEYIRKLVASFKGESTIVWCKYNDEQDKLASIMPDAVNISGSTPHEERMALIDEFKAGRRKVLISKPKILGFGLNLQICTRQVFSTLQDSYEEFYQAVKRSNRYGSTMPLNVHIPLTDLERPMVETVLRKAKRIQQDTEEQEKLFQEQAFATAIKKG